MNNSTLAGGYQPRPIRKIYLFTNESGQFVACADDGKLTFVDSPLQAVKCHHAWLTREVAERKLKNAVTMIRDCPLLKVTHAYVRLGPMGWMMASEEGYRR